MLDLDWSSIPGALPLLASGLWVTARITLTALVAGLLVGTLLAVARLYGGRGAAWPAAAYVNVMRSVPLVMVILWFYLIVPSLWTAFTGQPPSGDTRLRSALVAFTLFEAAYYSEIIRAGLKSVPRGQTWASLALGLTPLQALRRVVLPQAVRRMMPLLLTQAVILFQDTSLVYVIGLADFFGTAYKVGDRDGRIVELLLFAGAIYFVISFTVSQVVRRIQGSRTA